MRPLLSLILAAVTALGATASGPRTPRLDAIPGTSQRICLPPPDSLRHTLATTPLHRIEGLWQFTADGASVAILRCDGTDPTAPLYCLVALPGPDMTLMPGTVVGYAAPTGHADTYDARLYTSRNEDGTTLSSPSTYTLTLSSDASRIAVKPYGRRLRLNWWRLLLPYRYRSLITPIEGRTPDTDGLLRLYPEPVPPLHPRYL